jgi:purine-nucleoside phosphorylase
MKLPLYLSFFARINQALWGFINTNYQSMKNPLLNYVLRISCILLLSFTAFSVHAQAPKVTGISPVKGPVGTNVTLTGSGFNPVAAQDVVFFGAVQTPVVSVAADGLSMVVTIPKGVDCKGITVTDLTTNKTGSSNKAFNITFSNDGNIKFNAAGIPFNTGFNVPDQVLSGDINRDGMPDLVICSEDDIVIYRNTTFGSSATFDNTSHIIHRPAGSAFIKKIEVADLNGDGLLDIIIGRQQGGIIYALNTTIPGQPNITFGTPVVFDIPGEFPNNITAADLDGDGKPELLIAGNNAVVTVLQNTTTDGAVGFTKIADIVDPLGNKPQRALVQDFDGDGIPEIVITTNNGYGVFKNTINPITLARNFDFSTGNQVGGVVNDFAIADMNNDGKFDLLVPSSTAGSGKITILLNTSSGGNLSFSTTAIIPVPGQSPKGLVIADIDGDGLKDLIVKGSGSAVAILKNTGLSGGLPTFTITSSATNPSQTDVAVGDFDLDGKPDLAVLDNFVDQLTIFSNDVQPMVAPPKITSLSQPSGKTNDIVTIDGTGFSAVLDKNVVFFGATQGIINSFSATQLKVVVPAGANFQNLTITNLQTGLSGQSVLPFGLVYSNGGKVVLGNPKSFAGIAGSVPEGAALGDLNGDGFADMATVSLGKVSVFQGTATGDFGTRFDFTTSPTYSGKSLQIGDLDGDGHPDLVFLNRETGHAIVLRNKGTSAIDFEAHKLFAMGIVNDENNLLLSDLDGDGKLDIVSGTILGISTVHNTSTPGSLVFEARVVKGIDTQSTEGFLNGIAVGDFDGDGKPDIAVALSDTQQISIFTNASTPGAITLSTQYDIATPGFNNALYAADLNNDNKLDLVYGNSSGKLNFQANTNQAVGVMSFAANPQLDIKLNQFTIFKLGFGDMDGDGSVDMVSSAGNVGGVKLFRNSGTAGGAIDFDLPQNYSGTQVTFGIVVGDVDGDARPDVLTANPNLSSISVFKNNAYVAPPTISSINPASGKVSDMVTINGTHFNIDKNKNVVYFGATKATVNSITTVGKAMHMQVTIPVAANYQNVTVTDIETGKIGLSDQPFNLTYSNGGKVVLGNPKSFAGIAGSVPEGAALGDLNGDGFADMATVSLGKVSVFQGTATGDFGTRFDFTTSPTYSGKSLQIGDLDGDGHPDLVFLNRETGHAIVLRNKGTSAIDFEAHKLFAMGIVNDENNLLLSDLDGDGKLDIVSGTILGISTVHNTSTPGSLVFEARVVKGIDTQSTEGFLNGIAVGDFDGDGKPDIAVALSDTQQISIFTNASTPGAITLSTQYDIATPGFNNALYAADLNNDNKLDLVYGNSSGKLNFQANTNQAVGVMSFAANPQLDIKLNQFTIFKLGFGDMDGDGSVDMVSSAGNVGGVKLFRNSGTAGGAIDFDLPQNYSGTQVTFGIVVGDVDGDARPDVLTANPNLSSISVFKNNAYIEPPIITSLNSGIGDVGQKIIITGLNFNADKTKNAVYFGATQAAISMASTTQLDVTVPFGASFDYISVTNTETAKTGYSKQQFKITLHGKSALDFTKQSYGSGGANGKPTAMAVADMNADGWPDLIITNTSKHLLSVLLNNPASPGEYTTQINVGTEPTGNPNAVAIGDFDGDGINDIAIADIINAKVYVYRTTHAGAFKLTIEAYKTFDAGVGTGTVTIGDLDKDGKPDLVTTNGVGSVSVLRNSSMGMGNINFEPKTDYDFAGAVISSAAIGDLDRDGWPDVIISNKTNSQLMILKNSSVTGNIALTTGLNIPTNTIPNKIVLGDVDFDGSIDIVVATTGGIEVLTNFNATVGVASFKAHPELAATLGAFNARYVSLGDLDGDLKIDLVVATDQHTKVIRNISTPGGGGLKLEEPVIYTDGFIVPNQVVVNDVTGDGRPDFITMNTVPHNVTVFTSVFDVPAIATVTPTKGPLDTQIKIVGAGFSLDPAQNIVFLGAVMAKVTSVVSAGEMYVNAPLGSDVQNISVTNLDNALSASTHLNFDLTYSSSGALAFADPVRILNTSVPLGIEAKDLDNDGKIDFVVTTPDNVLQVYKNISTTNNVIFDQPILLTASGEQRSVKIADLDGDGLLDLVAANFGLNSVDIFLNISNKAPNSPLLFAAPQTLATGDLPYRIEVRDLDRDGKNDIITLNTGSMSIFHNNSFYGSLAFSNKQDITTSANTREFAIADAINDDGYQDIFVGTSGNIIDLFTNTSKPGVISFTKTGIFLAATSVSGLKVADLNNDHLPDLIASTSSNEVIVKKNLGDGTFGTNEGYLVINSDQIALGDVDGDGNIDIAVAQTGANHKIGILKNDPMHVGKFLPVVDFATVGSDRPYTMSLEDVDGDGKLDIAALITSAETNLSILLNTQLISTKVVTLPATEITTTGAVLNANVKAYVGDVVVSFEYGTDPALVSSTSINATINPFVGINDGATASSVAWSQTVPGTYYYRAVANGTNERAEGAILSVVIPAVPITVAGFNPINANPNNGKAGFVTYQIDFTGVVDNLSSFNFSTVTTGTVNVTNISKAVPVPGAPFSYTVDVSISGGSGTLQLKLNTSFGATATVINLPATSEVYVIDATAPVTPTGLAAHSWDATIKLTWDLNNVEPDFKEYRIYGDASMSTTLLTTVPNGSGEHTFNGLTNGKQYFYRITAVDNAGNESPFSNQVDGTPIAGTFPKSTQHIAFDVLSEVTYGDDDFVAGPAKSDANLDVTYTTSDANIANHCNGQ